MVKIKPAFTLPDDSDPSLRAFIHSFLLLIDKILPDEVQKDHSNLNNLLPLIQCTAHPNSQGISIVVLCASTYAHGTGRFVSDVLSRWLIPGKILELGATRTFSFFFEGNPTEYLINERLAIVSSQEDSVLVQQNFPSLAKEMRLTLQAVFHARHLLSVKTLSAQEKNALIQENISSLMDRPSKEFRLSIHDQMHHFFIALSAEEKIKQIKAHITPIFNSRTKTFDRDIFSEIQHFVLLFREKFTALRSLRYISRLICYQYLFRKSLQLAISHNPSERHISLKIFHVKNPYPVLGILVGVNLLRENELFKKKHFKEAILSCISNVAEVPDSFVVDWRSDKTPTFYIEIEKQDKKRFSISEVRRLRQKLASEVRERIENVSHPVFVSRNEEEVLRHIVILSNELKYVRDIPQVVINFHNQTHLHLTFNVILLRLLKSDTQCLKKQLPSHIAIEEVKVVGYLRNKYPKEMNTFKVTLAKAPFFRKDYSLDIHKARQAVVSELTQILGEFRDYNGGMIAKQIETLSLLRELLHKEKIHNDFLMENFFYAIEPPTMQSLLHPNVLQTAFLMLLEALECDFKHSRCFFKTTTRASMLITVIAAPHTSLKKAILTNLAHLHISSAQLSFSSLTTHGRTCLILFYHSTEHHKHLQFIEAIENFLTITYFNNQRVTDLTALSS